MQVTPALWPFEVTNALVTPNAAGPDQRCRGAGARVSGDGLRLLPIRHRAPPGACRSGQQRFSAWLERYRRLTAYDAANSNMAIREELPLATLDGDLRKAAAAADAALVELAP